MSEKTTSGSPRPSTGASHVVQVHPFTVGFGRAPGPLKAAFQRRGRIWTVDLQSQLRSPAELANWISAYHPVETQMMAAGVRARFERLRPEWETLVNHFSVDQFHVDGNSATLHLRGELEIVNQLRAADELGHPFIRDEFKPLARPKLTPRQRFVLHKCLEWGYYDVPRRATLEAIAARLQTGVNTLSVVLRNAEAIVIRNFIRSDTAPTDPSRRRRGNDGVSADGVGVAGA